VLVVGLVLIVAAIAAGGWVWMHKRADNLVKPTVSNLPEVKQETVKTNVAGKYLFSGTSTWARATERDSKGDYNWPFSYLNTFDTYDAWSTDLECPITNNVVPYATQISQLVFNCRPEFLPAATKYITLYDLANNHTDNQGGSKGLAETRKHLDAAGAQYYGSFDPSVADDVCEVIALPVRIQTTGKTDGKGTLPVAFCAWHYFYRKPLPGEIAVMDKYAKIMPVFAFVEAGAEYRPKADAIQEEIAHQIVDHGPEFLVANSPHWVQNTEVYKDKLIVYSTGNFIFDQVDTETRRGASLDVQISVVRDANIDKWLALGDSCKSFKDDCLTRAEQQNMTKPKLTYIFGVVGSQGGVGIPTRKADVATQKAIEERMNWIETLKALGQTTQ
jgi:poly-gamma-glutamate synthesis protein (capsule biosynthesis protein)